MAVKLEARPFAEAVAALRARSGSQVESWHWTDLWEQEHAKAFTVAKSAGFDILNDIYSGLETALKEGRTGRDFARDLEPLLVRKGWWGRQDVPDPETGETSTVQLGSLKRLNTIFDANMRVSYATGHWARFERTKATRPWLRYVAVMDGRARPEHAARHNLCLRVDDPYWDVWAPPCGFGCRCTLQSLSDRDVERMRGQLKFTPPPDRYRAWTNSRTGEVIQIPEGVDPGWAYNPGKAGYQAVQAADKLAAAPPRLAAAAVADPSWPARQLADEFGKWFDETLASDRTTSRTLWPVGALDDTILHGLSARDIVPDSGAITVQQDAVRHMVRDAKAARGASVPLDLLRRMPELLRSPRAVLFDKRDPALLYVFDVPGEVRVAKLVVRVNYTTVAREKGSPRQRVTTNAVRTAGLVDARVLRDPGLYDIIRGDV